MEAGMNFIREFTSSANGRRDVFEQVVIAALGTIIGVAALVIFTFLFCIAYSALAQARDNGQWGDMPTNVRSWFQSLMQPDNPSMSCCGEADAFEADTFEIDGDHYVAIITDGKGVLPPGTRIPVPNTKMKWDRANPTGHGIIFLANTPLNADDHGLPHVYCYVAPGGM
jgi:hypothetical protein